MGKYKDVYLYKQKDGKYRMNSSNPKGESTSTKISIPSSKQYKNLQKLILKYNKAKGDKEETEIKKIIEQFKVEINEMATTAASGAYEVKTGGVVKRDLYKFNEMRVVTSDLIIEAVKKIMFERAKTCHYYNLSEIRTRDVYQMAKRKLYEKANNDLRTSSEKNQKSHYTEIENKVEAYKKDNMSEKSESQEKSDSMAGYDKMDTDEFKATRNGRGVLDFELENINSEEHQKRIEKDVVEDAETLTQNTADSEASKEIAKQQIKNSEIRKKMKKQPIDKMNRVGDFPYSTPDELNEQLISHLKTKHQVGKKVAFKRKYVTENALVSSLPDVLKEHGLKSLLTDGERTVVVEWRGGKANGRAELIESRNAKKELTEMRKIQQYSNYQSQKTFMTESNTNDDTWKMMLESVKKK